MRGSSGSNPRDVSQPGAGNNASQSNGQTNAQHQSRSQSGTKFSTSTYAQQLKKQVQASSQANGIDPLSAKQYLQSYLSEHPTSQQQQSSTAKVPLKVIKQVQQTLAASNTNTQIQPQQNSYKQSQNYASANSQNTSKPSAAELAAEAASNGRVVASSPGSRHQLNRGVAGGQSTQYMRNNHDATQSSHQNNNISSSMNELQQFERRKDRASSSSKQKLLSTSQSQENSLGGQAGQTGGGQLSRSLVRPSSKNRLASQQPTSHTQKIYPHGSNNGQQHHTQKTSQSQPRGQSPKTSAAQVPSNPSKTNPSNQLNMSGQNLQNYFDNQIPQYQVSSSKNLPRKKRIAVNNNGHGLKTEPSEVSLNSGTGRQQSRGKTSNLPPMGQQRAPSPGAAAFAGQKGSSSSGEVVKRPNSRNASNSNRPSGADHGPQPFQKEELFLNVDSQYNDLIIQMIQPNRAHFDFEGCTQYVMNASELSNQALAKLLFQRKNIPLPKVPDQMQIKPPKSQGRSRNIDGVTSFGKNGAAGQSTASFFNTKKSFTAATFSQASSGSLDNAIKRAEGYHDGPDPNQILGKDFHNMIRHELRSNTPEAIKQLMPDYQPAKYSAKRNGIVAAYGANTNQGIVRNYNEDRVAIILNIMKPKSKQFNGAEWPKCSFFGIYDGHGGHVCADFLRDYLHQFIIKDSHFPKEPIQAIKNGFKEAEKLFLEFAEGQQYEVGDIDRSGSCAIVALIIDDMCYIGNTGDSRACMSSDGGRQVIGLSNDHKPTDDIEMHRILTNNGRIYQNASIVNVQQSVGNIQSQIVLGPHRVFPGRLSVCRTFGDIEAKLAKLDGNVRVVVADPDVTAFRIDRDKHDFIVIGCDGIFDKLENRDCVHLVQQACLMEETGTEALANANDEEQVGSQKQGKTQDERRHKLAGLAVDSILKTDAMRRSCDNITAVVIAFDNFYRKLDQSKRGFKNGVVTQGQQDHEVFEEIQFQPVSDAFNSSENVIYIESDDHVESAAEDQNTDGVDEQSKVIDQSSAVKQAQQAKSLLYGDTGTTQPNAGSAQQVAAMTMLQNPAPAFDANGVPNPYAGVNPVSTQAERILSEIAEEDSISMISDKPRRFKPSDCHTPADPVTNSFMGSIRESQNVVTASRLKETANKLLMNEPLTNFTGPNQTATGKVIPSKQGQQAQSHVPNPYLNDDRKRPLVGNGSALISQKPGSLKASQQQSATSSGVSTIHHGEVVVSSQQPNTINSSDSQKPGHPRPTSSGQGQRQGSSQDKRSKQGGTIHQIIDNSGQMRSRQSRGNKNFGYDQNNAMISQTVPSLPNNASRSSTNNAYGNIIGSYMQSSGPQVGVGSNTQAVNSHNTSLNNIVAPGGSGNRAHSQSQLAQLTAQQIHQASAGAQHNLIQQSSSGLNSQSAQVMPSLNDTSATSNTSSLQQQQANSAGNLYQVKVKGRRSSNQSHQRGTYTNQQNSQSQSNAQSQSSMPPPTSQSLLPISSQQSNISLANQKGIGMRSQQNQKASSEPGSKNKSKTQQPNKLVELFRQVDNQGGVNNTTQQHVNTSGSVVANSNQFIPKGSLSSNNQQMLMRTMQMNNPLAHGAQVHNIQIKPISATKRRSGASTQQNIVNAQFHNSNNQQQPAGPSQSNAQMSVSNILHSRPSKDGSNKAQFSQTSVLKNNAEYQAASNSGKQAKQPNNKLISQYLAQVNQNTSTQPPSHQSTAGAQQPAQQYPGGAYASRSTRKTGGTEKSPGVLSRAQRVQMTYNQSLPLSKSSLSHHPTGSNTNPDQSASLSQHPSRQNTSHGKQSLTNNLKSSSSVGNAYAQALLPPNGQKSSKTDGKSRNSNSHTSGSNSHLPKWQSLNHVMASGSGVSQSQTQNFELTHQQQIGSQQHLNPATKKRKSTNI